MDIYEEIDLLYLDNEDSTYSGLSEYEKAELKEYRTFRDKMDKIFQ